VLGRLGSIRHRGETHEFCAADQERAVRPQEEMIERCRGLVAAGAADERGAAR
jgi:hypothetical protein